MEERNIPITETSPDKDEGTKGSLSAHYAYSHLEEVMFIEKAGECHIWITYVYDQQKRPVVDHLGVTVQGYCLDDYVAQLRNSRQDFPEETGLDLLPSLLDREPTKAYTQGYTNE